MWGGVTKGLASEKFSESIKKLGKTKTIIEKIKRITEKPRVSLIEK
ncbi:MAG: hypothetical protein MRQ09_06855 [Candidatus Midichloria sp.]|nr:hypothetical protein [Candidatus Midichloria sp.]